MAFPGLDSWVDMQVRNHLSTKEDLEFANAQHGDGQFCVFPNRSSLIDDEDVNDMVARCNHLMHIAACGDELDDMGTSGSYDILNGGRKVCHVSWKCPAGRDRPNEMDISDLDDDNYVVECKGAGLDPGPIGHVSIRIRDSI